MVIDLGVDLEPEGVNYEPEPLHLLREHLRRLCEGGIQGRADFVRHVRPARKPLPKVEVDPRDMLRLLDALDEAEREARDG